jgi:hypothetical protein
MRFFLCPVCGWSSSNEGDIAEGYCGSCHAWTGQPGVTPDAPLASMTGYWNINVNGPVLPPLPWGDPDADILGDIRAEMNAARARYSYAEPGEVLLTPGVLIDHPGWTYVGTEGDEVLFRLDETDYPRVASWRPDVSLGRCTLQYTRGQAPEIRVGREVMARAVMERIRVTDVTRAWSWEELAEQAGLGSARYRCGSCGHEMEVPPGHGRLVLCGNHPGERMLRTMARVDRVPPGLGPWEAGSIGAAAQDPGCLITEAIEGWQIAQAGRDIIAGAVLEWEAAQERARENVFTDLRQALEARSGLTDAQYEEQVRRVDRQIRAGYGLPAQGVLDRNPDMMLDTQVAARARELEEQMPPRPRRMTSRQHAREASDRAEQFLKRLDGEGYGVIAKANQVDEETDSIPELPLLGVEQGGNAARWTPGSPIL